MQLSETERVYRLLKHEIVSGLREPGSQLSQESVAVHTNASRTPVREAILRLASDGLVRMTPWQKAVVREITMRDYIEINQLRLLLEGSAARLAAGNIPEELLNSFDRDMQKLRAESEPAPQKVAELDQQIHRAIADHSGNRRLAQWIGQLNDLTALGRKQDVERRSDSMIASLQEIVDMLQRRDAMGAQRVLEQHIVEFTVSLGEMDYWSSVATAKRE